MLKFAVCDDDPNELNGITRLLDAYRAKTGAALTYGAFSDAEALLDAMKKQTYDVIILDIMMPGITGIQAAREIGSFDEGIKLIFLTSSAEYAVESYTLDANDYLLKPASADKLFHTLDKLFFRAERSGATLNVKSPSGIARISYSRIEFVEVLNKRLLFHFTDGGVKEISAALSDYEEELLGRDAFIKTHRSFIVNMEHIRSLSAQDIVTYAGRTVPVSRRLYQTVREAYMRYLFVEKGVE